MVENNSVYWKRCGFLLGSRELQNVALVLLGPVVWISSTTALLVRIFGGRIAVRARRDCSYQMRSTRNLHTPKALRQCQ